jgi:CheY-like chemotaxis protein
VTIEFSDNGAGIAPEKIRRIFNAFEQAESPTPTGLGLGLAICKALVERHRGTIEARSEGVGRGSTFRITLPAAQPVVKAKPSAPAVMPDQSGLRLLVVDDHRDTLETLQVLLKRRGYSVRTAGSIAQALQVADEFEFDMLVSDIGLPDGRGTDLLQRLEKRSRHPFLAIAMSGFGTDEDLRSSRHAGFAQHLTKPVEFDILHETIARLSSDLPKSPGVSDQ